MTTKRTHVMVYLDPALDEWWETVEEGEGSKTINKILKEYVASLKGQPTLEQRVAKIEQFIISVSKKK